MDLGLQNLFSFFPSASRYFIFGPTHFYIFVKLIVFVRFCYVFLFLVGVRILRNSFSWWSDKTTEQLVLNKAERVTDVYFLLYNGIGHIGCNRWYPIFLMINCLYSYLILWFPNMIMCLWCFRVHELVDKKKMEVITFLQFTLTFMVQITRKYFSLILNKIVYFFFVLLFVFI